LQDAFMNELERNDRSMINTINELTGARLELEGRAAAGALGGAVLVSWPDSRPAVVTVFHGDVAAAQRVAAAVNALAAVGLPVPRHDLVVDLGDSVAFVQQRLPSGPTQRFSEAQVNAIWAINDRFAGAAAAVTDVLPVSEWFLPEGDRTYDGVLGLARGRGQRTAAVVADLVAVAEANVDQLGGRDVVHVDLNAANVLFDHRNRATGVVDWNLGIFTGPRDLALVQTRFDREWFVQSPGADAAETAAARYLDQTLAERIDQPRLRAWWAFWLLHWLPKAFRLEQPSIVEWHLALAEERVLS
jgi:aminoglycoside phosphotransferase (APT) family kinase protein